MNKIIEFFIIKVFPLIKEWIVKILSFCKLTWENFLLLDKGEKLDVYFSLIGIVFTLVAIFIAIFIPTKIALYQQWQSLISDYRSSEFGDALRLITHWAYNLKKDLPSENDSEDNVLKERILSEYKKMFDDCESRNCQNKKNCEQQYTDLMKLNNSNCLFNSLEKARRLFIQYYWQLYLFSKKSGSKEFMKEFFDKNELNIIAIVAYMNKAVDGIKGMYKDLKNPDGTFQKYPKKENGEKDSIKHLRELYKFIKKNCRKNGR